MFCGAYRSDTVCALTGMAANTALNILTQSKLQCKMHKW